MTVLLKDPLGLSLTEPYWFYTSWSSVAGLGPTSSGRQYFNVNAPLMPTIFFIPPNLTSLGPSTILGSLVDILGEILTTKILKDPQR